MLIQQIISFLSSPSLLYLPFYLKPLFIEEYHIRVLCVCNQNRPLGALSNIIYNSFLPLRHQQSLEYAMTFLRPVTL